MVLTDNEITDETRMIIVQVGDIEVGWIVDEANDVITVHQEEVESSPESAEKEGQSWVTGIIKHDQRLFNIGHSCRCCPRQERSRCTVY
ncbi:chemotaxis protein CheW [Bacillus safensis FO-36b] [Bacillus safensis subsp. safensis]